MKTIEIDSDIYVHILQNTSEIGESASSILRRLLGLGAASGPGSSGSPQESELAKLLRSTEFVYAKGVVGRFLVVLRWLHAKNPTDFAKVEEIKGRGRLYFSREEKTLEESGRNVNPKQIPGTPYWVITTSPTNLKQEMLERAMLVLGYGVADIKSATEAIAR